MKDVKKINLSKISTTTKGAISGSNKANVNKNINVNKIKVQKVNVNNVKNSKDNNKTVYKVVKVTDKGNKKLGYTTANNITLKNNSSVKLKNKSADYKIKYKKFDAEQGVPQGYTMVGKYHALIQTDEKNHKAKLIFLDENGKIVKEQEINENCGHANDMEYNSKKNQLVIPYKGKNGKEKIKIVDLKNLENDKNLKIETKVLPIHVGAISYNNKENAYYVTHQPNGKDSTGKIIKLNADTFEIDRKYGKSGKVDYKGAFDFSDDTSYVTQGMTTDKNNNIYYVATNLDDWSNYIIKYDSNGKKIGKYKVEHQGSSRAELESIKFDSKGDLYGNFAIKKEDGTTKKLKIAKIDIQTPTTGDTTKKGLA